MCPAPSATQPRSCRGPGRVPGPTRVCFLAPVSSKVRQGALGGRCRHGPGFRVNVGGTELGKRLGENGWGPREDLTCKNLAHEEPSRPASSQQGSCRVFLSGLEAARAPVGVRVECQAVLPSQNGGLGRDLWRRFLRGLEAGSAIQASAGLAPRRRCLAGDGRPARVRTHSRVPPGVQTSSSHRDTSPGRGPPFIKCLVFT